MMQSHGMQSFAITSTILLLFTAVEVVKPKFYHASFHQDFPVTKFR